jgi:predicted PurR-regulated permease PerM
LALVILAFTLLMLLEVLGTLFFAITVAYVVLPVKRWIVAKGVPNRLSTAIATCFVFIAAIAIVAPLLTVVYQRRDLLLTYLQDLPATVTIETFGFTYILEIGDVIPVVRTVLTDTALSLARAAPLLLTKLFLFTFIVYALMLKPDVIRRALIRVVPTEHESDLRIFHERLRNTLYGIYVVQAATAVGTFVIALVVFSILGYEAFLAFAVFAGILQFIPILGPSLLVIAISAGEYVSGHPESAAVTLVVGLVVIGALPDLILRPLLAQRTADLAPSLYFIGFIAGGLSWGAVGVIAGPVVIAILIQAFEIASEHRDQSPSPSRVGT